MALAPDLSSIASPFMITQVLPGGTSLGRQRFSPNKMLIPRVGLKELQREGILKDILSSCFLG